MLAPVLALLVLMHGLVHLARVVDSGHGMVVVVIVATAAATTTLVARVVVSVL